MNHFHKAVSLIQQSKHLLLLTHQGPDGDGIGSEFALYHALRAQGKKVSIHNRDGVPRLYQYLAAADQVTRGDYHEVFAEADLLLALDCGTKPRLGLRDSCFQAPLLNIDHHASNTLFGDYQWVDANACSTGIMVYQLLKALSVPIPKLSATALYIALATDTGQFRYRCDAEVFRCAADLVDCGAEPYEISTHLDGGRSLAELRLLAASLATLRLSHDEQVAWMYVDDAMYQRFQVDEEHTEGFVDYARSLKDVAIAVFIRAESTNRWKVSMRSTADFDLSGFMTALGGGGHKHAGGCSLQGSLVEVETQLAKALQGLFA